MLLLRTLSVHAALEELAESDIDRTTASESIGARSPWASMPDFIMEGVLQQHSVTPFKEFNHGSLREVCRHWKLVHDRTLVHWRPSRLPHNLCQRCDGGRFPNVRCAGVFSQHSTRYCCDCAVRYDVYFGSRGKVIYSPLGRATMRTWGEQ
jgi:hypothetical protein